MPLPSVGYFYHLRLAKTPQLSKAQQLYEICKKKVFGLFPAWFGRLGSLLHRRRSAAGQTGNACRFPNEIRVKEDV
jgi:hypothetical protein